MTFDDLIKNRRSIRNDEDYPVSIEVIQEIINESAFVPSAGNEQPGYLSWQMIKK